MNNEIGWILDTYIQGGEAILWLRTHRSQILKLMDEYSPSFYVLPKDPEEEQILHNMLNSHPDVETINFEEKFTELGSNKKERLIHVVVDNAYNYRGINKGVEDLPQTKQLFNVDLLHVQQYIFNQLKIPPTSKVEVQFDNENRLVSAKRIDDDWEIPPPPFTTLFFNIQVDSPTLTPDAGKDPIKRIETRFDGEKQVFQDDEPKLLREFASYIKGKDPDFLVCPECDEFTFPYLFRRSRPLKPALQMGRESVDQRRLGKPLPYWVLGRVAVNYHLWTCSFEAWGLAGLVERSRFSFLPPGIAMRWTANRIIDSRNCYELLSRGYVIKRDHGHYEWARPIQEVYYRDRGGLIFAPKIGLVHENVAELDFESEYPQLIVRDGLSYETVTPEGVFPREDALLPIITERTLNRRLHFKRLRKKFAKDSKEWLWCDQRQESLKMILVCIYGTSGCCWNRYGNVLCFEEINKRSREALIETVNLVSRLGYEVVYCDTDSVFLKRPEATKSEYEELCMRIRDHVNLPISLDHHYKFLLLLPLESDPSGRMEAQKHYLGLLTNGETLARGIEIRRHDAPPFIKEFQVKLIETLFDCENAEEVRAKGYRNALDLISKTIDKLMEEEIPPEKLVVSKILRRPIGKYTRMFPHVSAAVQMAGRGRAVKKGEKIRFIYMNARHHSPLCRVEPYSPDMRGFRFDKEKYRDMVLDAAETVLSTFGFSRTSFGLKQETQSFPRCLWREQEHESRLEKETEKNMERYRWRRQGM